MRNMSFSMTTPQFLDETKDITRRLGWLFLEAGDLVMAIEKGQGLKKGEKVKRLGVIEIVTVRRERLDAITQEEVVREGFPNWSPQQFIEHFCKFAGCMPWTVITPIEFKRPDKGLAAALTDLGIRTRQVEGQRRRAADVRRKFNRVIRERDTLKRREHDLIRMLNGKEATEADRHLIQMVDQFGPPSTDISNAADRAQSRLDRDKAREKELELSR